VDYLTTFSVTKVYSVGYGGNKIYKICKITYYGYAPTLLVALNANYESFLALVNKINTSYSTVILYDLNTALRGAEYLMINR
jgi:hypothetical protein